LRAYRVCGDKERGVVKDDSHQGKESIADLLFD
jgi:hypothetical protein